MLKSNKFFKRIVLVFVLSWLMQHLLATQQHRRLTEREMAFVDSSVWIEQIPLSDRDCIKLAPLSGD